MFQMRAYEKAGGMGGGEHPATAGNLQKQMHRARPARRASLGYHWFMPARPCPDLPLFFAVHGIGRRAADQVRLFAPFMEAIGGILIAPVFGKRRFAGYQRLKHARRDIRSDLALRQLIALAHQRFGKPQAPVVMFGYSGGGQFVHRYAMAYPRQIERMAIAAPGWFTFPDIRLRFPRGILETSALPDLDFDGSRFLKIPTLVLVGDKDVRRDGSLNRRGAIDEQQGRHRVERACRWIDAMRSAAGRYGYPSPCRLHIVPGCGHSFRDCMDTGQMGWPIVRFLFEEYR